MSSLGNTFEGGTSGVTIAAGDGGSGDAFDSTSIGSGTALTYDNTHAASSSTLAMKFSTGATATSVYVQWSTSLGTVSTVYGRMYVYLTANPASNTSMMALLSGSTVRARIQITTAGHVLVQDAALATVTTSTASLTLNAWNRIEFSFTLSATVGQSEAKLFTTPDSTTVTETNTSAANRNFGGSADRIRFGIVGSATNFGPAWLDNLVANTTGYPGPAVLTIAPTGIGTSVAFGSATVANATGGTIAPTGIASSVAFGSAVVSEGAGASQSDLPPVFGVAWHAFHDGNTGYWTGNTPTALWEAHYQQILASGVGLIRVDLGWGNWQSTQAGGINANASWGVRLNYLLSRTNADGLKVMAMLYRSPAFANDAGVSGAYFPNTAHLPDWSAWCAFMAQTYPSVYAWEGWNEPNLAQFTGIADYATRVTAYVAVQQAMWNAIRGVNPAAIVTGMGPSMPAGAGTATGSGDRFIADCYAAGARGSFNVLAFHPYQGNQNQPPEATDRTDGARMANYDLIRQVMIAAGDRALPTWATEQGWSVHLNTTGFANGINSTDWNLAADYHKRTAEWYRLNAPEVRCVVPYTVWNQIVDVHQDGFRWFADDGTARPAWSVMTAYHATFGGSRALVDSVAATAQNFLNTLEGGTDTTAVTHANSGGASGDAFTTVTIGTSATVAYSATHAAHGGLGLKVATSATSAQAYVAWVLAARASLYGRVYLYPTAYHTASATIVQIASGTVARVKIQLKTDGKLVIQDAASATAATSTTAVPLNAWTRLEWAVSLDAAAGAMTLAIYTTKDSTTAAETLSVSAKNFGGPADTVRIGVSAGQISFPALYLDDLNVNDNGLVGPAVQTITPTGTATSVAFGAPTVAKRQVLTPTGIGTSVAFGTAVVSHPAAGNGVPPGNWTVEISTGNPASQPGQLTWTDISAKVLTVGSGRPFTITAGRAEEFSYAEPSQLSGLVLDNTAGDFTPSNTAGAYYPNWHDGIYIRVTTYSATTSSRRFTGWISDIQLAWAQQPFLSTATVTATGLLAKLAQRHTSLRSLLELETVYPTEPAGYWNLAESEGTTASSQTSNNQAALSLAGAGGAVTFGGATGPGTDGLTATVFAPLVSDTTGDLLAGGYLTGTLTAGLPYDATHALAVSCWFDYTGGYGNVTPWLVELLGTAFQLGVQIADDRSITAVLATTIDGAPVTTVTGPLAVRGRTHHVMLRCARGAPLSLVVDGVPYTGGTTTALTKTVTSVRAGRQYQGALSHVAVWSTLPTTADAARHYTAGTTGLTGQRTGPAAARIAILVGVPTSGIQAETGMSRVGPIQTAGRDPVSVLQEIQDAEGGLVFADGDSRLIVHARSHRWNVASVWDIPNNEITEDLTISVNPATAQNDITVTRKGGASYRLVDQASINARGRYPSAPELTVYADADARDRARFLIDNYATPTERVSAITLDLMTIPAADLTKALALKFGDLITLPGLTHIALGGLFVEGWQETIGMDQHTLSITASPAPQAGSTFWRLGRAGQSELDTTARLAQ